VVSCSYLALVPRDSVQIQAADDAADARWFTLLEEGPDEGVILEAAEERITLKELAFDHCEIVECALDRLRGK
jgi:hypothetical protein